MARTTYFSVIAAAALTATMVAAPLSAEPIDRLTFLTFSGPVQIPGTTLDAGTYRFRLANPNGGREVMQVLSNDRSKVYAMFFTIPDSRMTVTNESTVTFRETPVGVPPAVKSLFYGGEHRGYEFLYPKGGPSMVADITPQPPVTYTPMIAATAPALTAEATPEPAFTPAPAPVETAAAEPAAAQPELAHTASPVPLVALGGLASLLIGLGAGFIRRFVA